MTSQLSVGLFLDDRTLWGASVETPLFGGSPKFKASFKYNILSLPEEDTPKLHFLSEITKLVISKLGLESGGVGMVFADSESFSRYFELPKIAEIDMRAAVGYEAQKYLPFALKELYFDYKSFDRAQSKKQGIVLAAAKKEIVNLWEQVVKRAGYRLDFVGPEGVAFFDAMRDKSAAADAGGVDILASVRENGSLGFVASKADELLMSHTVKIPSVVVSGEEALCRINSDSVARQISLLLNYFGKNFRGLKVRELKISVDAGSVEENLEATLKTQLDLPVRCVDRSSSFTGAPKNLLYPEMIALSAAVSRIKQPFGFNSIKPLNLLAVTKQKNSFLGDRPATWEEEKRQLKRLLFFEVSVIVAFFLAIHFFFWLKIYESKNLFIRNRPQISGVSSLPDLAAMETASDSLNQKIFFLNTVFSKRIDWTPKLSEVANLLPSSATLDVLEIDDHQIKGADFSKSIRLEGRINRAGDDVETLNHYVDALRANHSFSDGIGTVKITKLRKLVNSKGNSGTSLFFIDSEAGS